ncbi:hypothetical protein Nmel_006270 [Mimus melanotis]
MCTHKNMGTEIYNKIRLCCFTWCKESKKDGFGLPETAR